jgi:hypothetical protein
MNILQAEIPLLYRIWVEIKDVERFNEVTQGFNKQNTYIEAVIPNVLLQFDILLTQEELLLLTLSFHSLDAMRIEDDGVGGVTYILA